MMLCTQQFIITYIPVLQQVQLDTHGDLLIQMVVLTKEFTLIEQQRRTVMQVLVLLLPQLQLWSFYHEIRP